MTKLERGTTKGLLLLVLTAPASVLVAQPEGARAGVPRLEALQPEEVRPGDIRELPRIELLSPADRTVVREERPTFSWQPRGRLAAGTRPRYTVRVLPVVVRRGADLAEVGPPLWEKTGLEAASVTYDGPPLAMERTYVWTVEASDREGRALAANAGLFARTIGGSFSFNLCLLFVQPPPAKVCQGQTVTLSAYLFTFPTGTTTYTLTPGSSGTWPASNQLSWTPSSTATYSLTLSQGACQRTAPPFTVAVVSPPAIGPATGSAAATQSDPPVWSQAVNVCCGSGLKLQVGGPLNGSVQWYSQPPAGNAVPGATGAAVNVNPGQLACNPGSPQTTLFHAEAATDPVCGPPASSNPVAVTVYPPPQLGSLTVTKPVLCADGVSTSQVNLTGSVGTVSWEKQPGCSGPWQPFLGSAPFTVGPLQAPECYKVKVKSGPCQVVEQVVTIGVDPQPVPGTLTAVPSPLCPGDDSVLTLSGASGNVQWFSSTNCTAAAVFASPMAGAAGNTVQNSNILPQTTCYGVQVSSPQGVCPPVQGPILPVTVLAPTTAPVISGPQILCPGKTVTLTAAASGGALQWYQDGDPWNGTGSTATVSEPGNYWVTLNGQCGAVDSNILTVDPDLLNVKITGPCCTCGGKKVKLCATASQGVGASSFLWSNGGVGACILVQPTATTTYTVTATDAASCSVSSSFTVTVCP